MIEQNHECYVDLEVAKLLKEAGFDWKCNGAFISEDGIQYAFIKMDAVCDSNNSKYNPYNISAPTLDVAQRWMREVKDVDIVVHIDYHYGEQYSKAYYCPFYIGTGDKLYTTEHFKTYEEALEAGIKNALEMILNKK
jgi:hypothetical protein